MLDVMAGYDPADPVTALGIGRIPTTYTASLARNAYEVRALACCVPYPEPAPITRRSTV